MVHSNRFTIRNAFTGKLLLAIEPEGAIVTLAAGEEVQVSEQFENEPITLKVLVDKDGSPLIAIWPGDGRMTVEKGGIDVLDLELE